MMEGKCERKPLVSCERVADENDVARSTACGATGVYVAGGVFASISGHEITRRRVIPRPREGVLYGVPRGKVHDVGK